MNVVDLSYLGPSAASIIMAFLFLQYITDKDKKQVKRDEMFAASLNKLNKSSEKIAQATIKGNQEAEKRNGHLAELQLKSQGIFERVADRNREVTMKVLEAVQCIDNQHVKHQTVDEQDVKKVGKK